MIAMKQLLKVWRRVCKYHRHADWLRLQRLAARHCGGAR